MAFKSLRCTTTSVAQLLWPGACNCHNFDFNLFVTKIEVSLIFFSNSARRSRSHVVYKIGVLKNYAKFTEQALAQRCPVKHYSLRLIKVHRETLVQETAF